MKDDQNQPDQEPRKVGRGLAKTFREEQDDSSADDSNHRAEQSHADGKKDILKKLGHLAGCVAIGVVPTSRANSMRGIYSTMLSHLDDSSTAGLVSASNEAVLEAFRESPKSFELIEPFLSKEQIDLIVSEATDGD